MNFWHYMALLGAALMVITLVIGQPAMALLSSGWPIFWREGQRERACAHCSGRNKEVDLAT